MPRDVEFMHELGNAENIDRYFQRIARRGQTFRIPEGLSMVFELGDNMPRTTFATGSELRTMLTHVLQGFYYRINDTFMVYGGSDEQTFLARYGNTDTVRDSINYSSRVVRNSFTHDETNPVRNMHMCSSNNYWNIYSLNLRATHGMNATGVMCIGCGMGGSINPLSEGINRE